MIPYNPMIDGNYRTRKFKQIFDDSDTFAEEYSESGVNFGEFGAGFDTNQLTLIYALLYARYGNSNIASDDENQFKYKVFTTIFMYAPTWFKRLEVQQKLRDMSIEELQLGSKAIYNSALNPSGLPSTASLEELKHINQQNTTNYKRSKVEAYGNLMTLLETDVTEEFISKFKKLFITIVQPDYPLWYVTTPEEQAILDEE
jgi:hypothetical protein